MTIITIGLGVIDPWLEDVGDIVSVPSEMSTVFCSCVDLLKQEWVTKLTKLVVFLVLPC